MSEQVKGWYEVYKCGCTSKIVSARRMLTGYCAKHGSNKVSVHYEPAEGGSGQ